jgi:hypothetical protein
MRVRARALHSTEGMERMSAAGQQKSKTEPMTIQIPARDPRVDARANATHERDADAEDRWICRGRD